MSFKTILRTTGFLIILFLVVFVSIDNNHSIDFYFRLALDKPVRASAAIVYFAMFAAGVIGGTLLNGGASKDSGRGSESSSKKR